MIAPEAFGAAWRVYLAVALPIADMRAADIGSNLKVDESLVVESF